MTSPLRRKRRITAWPITVPKGAISFAVLLGLGSASAQPPSSISNSVERKVYFQKPAETVVPAQAIAPPAPPPLFQPLSMPVLQTPPPVSNNGLGTPPPIVNSPLEATPAVQPAPAATAVPLAQPTPPDNRNSLLPPKRDEVFRFDSDSELQERIRREAPLMQDGRKQDVYFPVISKPTTAPRLNRAMPPMQVMIEPAYVVHRRLFFEEKNSERAGWDYGSAQPVIAALHFYRDCLVLPHKLASNLMEPYDTSAGKCLPGSPTPLLWYPPEITMFGGAVGAATIVGVAAVLP